jgi:hypothetical protein
MLPTYFETRMKRNIFGGIQSKGVHFDVSHKC